MARQPWVWRQSAVAVAQSVALSGWARLVNPLYRQGTPELYAAGRRAGEYALTFFRAPDSIAEWAPE